MGMQNYPRSKCVKFVARTWQSWGHKMSLQKDMASQEAQFRGSSDEENGDGSPIEDKRCNLFDKPQKFCQRCSEFHTADDWMETCERYMGAAPIRQCKTCGGWHPLDRWSGNCMPEPNWNESDLNVCRMFISDNLESLGGLNGIQCQASGIYFTSKKKLRNEYKARGMIEVGNDAQRMKPFVKPKPDRKKIKEALHRSLSMVQNEGATAANFRARSKVKTAFGRVAAK